MSERRITAGVQGDDEVVLELLNEFAEVQVRKVRTRNGARLEIVSPRTGTSVRLCPVELEALTRASDEALSALVGSRLNTTPPT
ncbi:MAG: dihydrodiol dehydrogenase [Acidimicrobiales bacterium]